MVERLIVAGLALTFLAATGGVANAQTNDSLRARRVSEQIKVRADGKTFKYAVDASDVFLPLAADQLFQARSAIQITYPNLNPLRLRVSGQVGKLQPDPRSTAISSLVEALGTLVGNIKPAFRTSGDPAPLAKGDEPATCPADVAKAESYFAEIRNNLFADSLSAPALKKELEDWAQAIDTAFASPSATGPGAIGMGIKKIETFKSSVDTFAKQAEPVVSAIEKGEKDTTICERAKKVYTQLVLLEPRVRLTALQGFRTWLQALITELTRDYVNGGWTQKTHFIVVDSVDPTIEGRRPVSLKTSAIAFDVSAGGAAVALTREDAAAGSLRVEMYSTFVPEVGVGLTSAFISKPKYGTAVREDGKTVIARGPDDEVSIDPALMVNLVCRCGGFFAEPMFQVGVATSKDTPALLVGGGLRLFSIGKGDFAIGGGWAFGWFKRLRTKKEGDVIASSVELDADLALYGKPRRGEYLSFQYKF